MSGFCQHTYTRKRASWLNMVEIELSVLVRQCLHRRMATIEELRHELEQLVNERNEKQARVNWQFTSEAAREKLRRHYHNVCSKN